MSSLSVSEPVAVSTPTTHSSPPAGRSGPTWRSGVFAGYSPVADRGFASWRGGAIQTATDYMSSVTWDQIARPVRLLKAWASAPELQLVLSVPMWPMEGGDLTLASRGAYDAYFTQLAHALVAAGRPDTILRIGWEFNTPFFRWSVSNRAQAAEYAAAWRHVVTAMRVPAGQRFSFVWNPDLGGNGIDPAAAYPGDAYVDAVGLDVYDRNTVPGQTPRQRWDSLVRQPYGLQWQARFAARHHKPLAFPEWGLVRSATHPMSAGGDDPDFIRHMYDWFAAHHTAFEDYFDADPPGGSAAFAITEPGAFPRAAAEYRQLFSSGPPRSIPQAR
jgi:hypothetical protein